MKKSNASKKGSRSGRNTTSTSNPSTRSETVLKYNGRIRAPPKSNQVITRLLPYVNFVSADVTGIITATYTNNPNGSPDWTSIKGVYTEYRTLGMRLRWVPNYTTYSTTGTPLGSGPLVLSTTRDTLSSPPLTMAAAISQQPYVVDSIMSHQTLSCRMDGLPDAEWYNTSLPTATFQINMLAIALTASAFYGTVFIDFLVQFRAPQ